MESITNPMNIALCNIRIATPRKNSSDNCEYRYAMNVKRYRCSRIRIGMIRADGDPLNLSRHYRSVNEYGKTDRIALSRY